MVMRSRPFPLIDNGFFDTCQIQFRIEIMDEEKGKENCKPDTGNQDHTYFLA